MDPHFQRLEKVFLVVSLLMEYPLQATMVGFLNNLLTWSHCFGHWMSLLYMSCPVFFNAAISAHC